MGWAKVHLNPDESRQVQVTVKSKYLSIYDESSNAWKLVPGSYGIMVGGSSQDLPLKQTISL